MKNKENDEKTLFEDYEVLYSKINECEECMQEGLTNMLDLMINMRNKVNESKEDK